MTVCFKARTSVTLSPAGFSPTSAWPKGRKDIAFRKAEQAVIRRAKTNRGNRRDSCPQTPSPRKYLSRDAILAARVTPREGSACSRTSHRRRGGVAIRPRNSKGWKTGSIYGPISTLVTARKSCHGGCTSLIGSFPRREVGLITGFLPTS